MNSTTRLLVSLLLAAFCLCGCDNQRRDGRDDDDSSANDDDDSSANDDDDSSPTDDDDISNDDDIAPEPKEVQLVASQDAVIRRLGPSGDETNYGAERYNNAQAWTNSSLGVVQQSLIDFDLSDLPAGAQVIEATLMLYSDPNSPQYPDGHDTSSGSNECIVSRIVTPWNEGSITWNNQPEYTEANSTTIPTSSLPFEDKAIDVSLLVQDMLDSSQGSFGFHIQLAIEIPYRRKVFASRDHPAAQLRPQLQIDYLD